MIIKSHLQHCDLLDNQQFIEIVLSQIIFQLCQGLIRVGRRDTHRQNSKASKKWQILTNHKSHV